MATPAVGRVLPANLNLVVMGSRVVANLIIMVETSMVAACLNIAIMVESTAITATRATKAISQVRCMAVKTIRDVA